jgi:glycosyltransferase involved in cell wall biosynthesis
MAARDKEARVEVVQVAGYYPPHPGGEEVVAQRLATLQARRHRVTVYTCDLGAEGAPRHEHDGALSVYRDRGWSVGNTPLIPGLVGRLLRHRPKPDVVHVHAGLALVPEMVRLATRLRGIPYVVHLHLMVRPSSGPGRILLPAYQRTLLPAFLRGAAGVICLTEAMRQTVIETFRVTPERAVVIPNGVEADRFRPGRPGTRQDRELLFVGRLTAQKNVLAAVEAMAHLPEATLRVVGGGELRPTLERRIRDLRLSNVRLEGAVGRDDLAPFYQRATAVLMPSSHEGLPLVMLEAMAAGAPVVCTALPELVETGGDAVVTVRRGTAEDLVGPIRSLLNDPARRDRLSVAARQRATRYAWPAVVDAVDELYRQVTRTTR